VEGTCFTVAEEVVLQGHPSTASHLATLLVDVLQVGGQNADVRGVEQHVIRERVTPEGEQDVIAPPGVVHGGEVQRDRDERMDVLYAGILYVDVGDDGSLVVIVRWSSTTGGG
jgi:hypothetical protein